MREVARDRHAWIVSFLYIGTFGSFIGFGFAFGQVLQVQFGETFNSPMRVVGLTFLGPLLGSLFRPVGGRLADRFGGSRVTAVVFAAMAAARRASCSSPRGSTRWRCSSAPSSRSSCSAGSATARRTR